MSKTAWYQARGVHNLLHPQGTPAPNKERRAWRTARPAFLATAATWRTSLDPRGLGPGARHKIGQSVTRTVTRVTLRVTVALELDQDPLAHPEPLVLLQHLQALADLLRRDRANDLQRLDRGRPKILRQHPEIRPAHPRRQVIARPARIVHVHPD